MMWKLIVPFFPLFFPWQGTSCKGIKLVSIHWKSLFLGLKPLGLKILFWVLTKPIWITECTKAGKSYFFFHGVLWAGIRTRQIYPELRLFVWILTLWSPHMWEVHRLYKSSVFVIQCQRCTNGIVYMRMYCFPFLNRYEVCVILYQRINLERSIC